MKELDESIFILNILHSEINRKVQALLHPSVYKLDPSVLNVFNNMTFERCVISIVSYFDEYDKHFGKQVPEDKKEIVGKIYRRVKKDIKKFSGLKDYRNQVLAHNLRVGGKPIYNLVNLQEYKIPQQVQEFTFLASSITHLTDAINTLFPKSHNKILKEFERFQRSIDVPPRPIATHEELERDLITQLNDIRGILAKINVRNAS